MMSSTRGGTKRSAATPPKAAGRTKQKGRPRKSRKPSSSSSPASSPFALRDNLISRECLQYLGTRSLVRFGAASKSHGGAVSDEVKRRKARIAAIETEVKALLGSPDDVPPRADVMKARALAAEAKIWIDDEVNLHDKICNKYVEDVDCQSDRLFSEERKKFIAEWTTVGTLHMLPLCFYLPPDGEATRPDKETLSWAEKKVSWLWGAEDHMGFVYTCDLSIPEYDYEDPFRKYEHTHASFFTYECMEGTAHQLAGDGRIDAFRIAARKAFFLAPNSRDCLWYTLKKADQFAAQEEEEE